MTDSAEVVLVVQGVQVVVGVQGVHVIVSVLQGVQVIVGVQGVQVVPGVNMYILVQCRCVVFVSVHFGCPQYCTECAVIHSSRAGGGEGGVDGGGRGGGSREMQDLQH